MNAIETLRVALEFSYEWIVPLAEDLADAPMMHPTAVGGNHPLWIMGHLAHSHAGLTSMISGSPSPVEEWGELFRGGTQPTDDANLYPLYSEVVKAYRLAHRDTLLVLHELSEADLNSAPPAVPEYLSEEPDFQTIGKLLLFIAMHDMSHRGQLADARRALGRKPFA